MSRPVTQSLAAALPKASARLGRFVLLEEVGAGAMGRVYAAYDEALDRRVAIKLLRSDGPQDEDRARIRREATAMARLSHPNVAQIHDAGEVDERLYLAMEYVAGDSLDVWQRGQPWRARLGMYLEAGRGLAAAHAAGVLHRDFKPQNVLIGRDARPRVIDFGLARPVAEQEAVAEPVDAFADTGSIFGLDLSVTRTGTVVGTPGYMALEQFKGQPLDAAADQFSFCVALYEALYARSPFPRDQLPRLLAALAAHDVAPPPADTPVPPWVHATLVRGLAPDPAARWPSMDALLRELGRDREHDPDTGRAQRLVLVATLAVVIAASTTYGVLATGLAIPTAGRGFVLALVVGVALSLMLLVLRRPIGQSALNRGVAAFFLCAIGVVLALRGVTWAIDADPRPTYVYELCALAALSLLGAASVAPWFGRLAALLCAAVPLAIWLPGWTIPIYAATTVLGVTLAVYFTRADGAHHQD